MQALDLDVDPIRDRGIGIAIKCGEETVADVYLEFYEGSIKLVVTDEMVQRQSDEPTLILPLLESLSPEARQLGKITMRPINIEP